MSSQNSLIPAPLCLGESYPHSSKFLNDDHHHPQFSVFIFPLLLGEAPTWHLPVRVSLVLTLNEAILHYVSHFLPVLSLSSSQALATVCGKTTYRWIRSSSKLTSNFLCNLSEGKDIDSPFRKSIKSKKFSHLHDSCFGPNCHGLTPGLSSRLLIGSHDSALDRIFTAVMFDWLKNNSFIHMLCSLLILSAQLYGFKYTYKAIQLPLH